jgi:hypothetical protein
MALKDTLKRLLEDSGSAQPLDKAAVIDEWRKAVAALMAQIQEFLREYKDAGTIQFTDGVTQLFEESLGTYQIPNLVLRAGPAVLMIQPIGRMVVDATGRVDLYRQGRGAEDERVVALRDASPNRPSSWVLSIPPDVEPFVIQSLPALERSLRRTYLPLTKENLEAALERLLR